MSARTAAATPGYWTFTATSRPPSRSRARYTCPIEAAAIGCSSKDSNTAGIRSSRSRSITLRICLNDTVGAASRSFASSRWNSSRYSSGTSPTSRKDITWPSFIAAPFIVPNTDTICLAVSTWRRASAAWLACSPRVTLAARVPNCFTVSVAASFPTVAVRRTLDLGTFFSRATPPMLRGARPYAHTYPLGWPMGKQSKDAVSEVCLSTRAIEDAAMRRPAVTPGVGPASRARCRPSRPASAPTPCVRRRSRRTAAPTSRARPARCRARSPARRGRATRG